MAEYLSKAANNSINRRALLIQLIILANICVVLALLSQTTTYHKSAVLTHNLTAQFALSKVE